VGSPVASESGAASTNAPIAALLSTARAMAAEPARAGASESNAAPAPLAAPAPAPALKAPIKKSRAVARAAPRYDPPRYAAPRYEQRYDSIGRAPYAFLRQYGSYGSQEY
jgi:hypothetical protein